MSPAEVRSVPRSSGRSARHTGPAGSPTVKSSLDSYGGHLNPRGETTHLALWVGKVMTFGQPADRMALRH